MRRVLLNCTVIDCTGAQPIDGAAIIIDDNKIAAIGRQAAIYGDRRAGDEVIDLAGCYALPGIMDMHVHLSLTYPLHSTPPGWEITLPWRCGKAANMALAAGITLIRTTGEGQHADIALKRAIAEGLAEGSRLICAGHGITPVAGHGAGSDWYVEASGPEDVRLKARQQLRAGADHIKLMITKGIAEPPELRGMPLMTLDEVRAAVQVAHGVGKRVCAHIGGPEGAKLAMTAGVDCLEHCYSLTDETVAMFGETGTYIVPTLTVNHAEDFFRQEGWSQQRLDQMSRDGDLHRAWFLKAVRAGAKPAAGTDMLPTDRPNIAGYPVAGLREIILMAQAGLSALEALQAGTKNAAELCQVGDRLGTLEAGKLADIVAVKGNPLADIRNVGAVAFVMKDGAVVTNNLV